MKQSFVRSDELDSAIALDMTVYIQHETEYSPLITFLRNMAYIGNQFILRKSFEILKVISFGIYIFPLLFNSGQCLLNRRMSNLA